MDDATSSAAEARLTPKEMLAADAYLNSMLKLERGWLILMREMGTAARSDNTGGDAAAAAPADDGDATAAISRRTLLASRKSPSSWDELVATRPDPRPGEYPVYPVDADGYFRLPDTITSAVVEIGPNKSPEWYAYIRSHPNAFLMLFEPIVFNITEKKCKKLSAQCALFPGAVAQVNRFAAMVSALHTECSSLLPVGTGCAARRELVQVPSLTLDTVLRFLPRRIPVYAITFDCQGTDLLAVAGLFHEAPRVANIIFECQDLPLRHHLMISPGAFNCGQLYSCVVEAGYVFAGCRSNIGPREFNCVAYNPFHALRDPQLRPILPPSLAKKHDQTVLHALQSALSCPDVFHTPYSRHRQHPFLRDSKDHTKLLLAAPRRTSPPVVVGPIDATGHLQPDTLEAAASNTSAFWIAIGKAAMGDVPSALRGMVGSRPPPTVITVADDAASESLSSEACHNGALKRLSRGCYAIPISVRSKPTSARGAGNNEGGNNNTVSLLDSILGRIHPKYAVVLWTSPSTPVAALAPPEGGLRWHAMVGTWVVGCYDGMKVPSPLNRGATTDGDGGGIEGDASSTTPTTCLEAYRALTASYQLILVECRQRSSTTTAGTQPSRPPSPQYKVCLFTHHALAAVVGHVTHPATLPTPPFDERSVLEATTLTNQ